MICIDVKDNCIKASGHAKEHLICNTISTLMWSFVTCLDACNTRGIINEEDEGYQKVSFVPSKNAEILRDGFEKCFAELAAAYPEEITLRGGLENIKT